MSPLPAHTQPDDLREFFTHQKECGLITDVRVKHGKTIAGKPQGNSYGIVEYAHENSVARSLRVASKKESVINGNRVRIYKAGSQVAKPSNTGTRQHQVQYGRGGRRGRNRT